MVPDRRYEIYSAIRRRRDDLVIESPAGGNQFDMGYLEVRGGRAYWAKALARSGANISKRETSVS